MSVTRANPAGYVLDNMEGAVDQATFLAATDTPVAIVGARGTGKMYIARILHASAGVPPRLWYSWTVVNFATVMMQTSASGELC
ncbi:sigma 54-interacting transcriptional regulator [Kineobactrum salinum]|uniref:Sigma-54 factor interaction domain-containing protein n=1 Tax=Kineobactrum salinum TaxID=2708301 RepID=A0A6C0U0U5_9GAMM|nr:sigma 54-interacting transcriptional regulator [Kineobactrum salinum]QIB65636.1 hypothetical protein G3T16_09675 [Kineobactrum salinum]